MEGVAVRNETAAVLGELELQSVHDCYSKVKTLKSFNFFTFPKEEICLKFSSALDSGKLFVQGC